MLIIIIQIQFNFVSISCNYGKLPQLLQEQSGFLIFQFPLSSLPSLAHEWSFQSLQSVQSGQRSPLQKRDNLIFVCLHLRVHQIYM